MSRLTMGRVICVAIFLLGAPGCNRSVPSDPATAKTVLDHLVPGTVARLDSLFDMVDSAAGAKHLILRESFELVVVCDKTDVLMRVTAMSESKWGDFVVSVHHPRQLAGTHQEVTGLGKRWPSVEVRASLSTIRTCEEVHIFVGAEQIKISLDDKWTIRTTERASSLAP